MTEKTTEIEGTTVVTRDGEPDRIFPLSGKARSKQEEWLEGLGTEFITVRFYVKGEFIDERHVDDRSTLETTIGMSMERFGVWYAIWDDPMLGGWSLYDRRQRVRKSYPTKEAAEMVVIHHGSK